MKLKIIIIIWPSVLNSRWYKILKTKQVRPQRRLLDGESAVEGDRISPLLLLLLLLCKQEIKINGNYRRINVYFNVENSLPNQFVDVNSIDLF